MRSFTVPWHCGSSMKRYAPSLSCALKCPGLPQARVPQPGPFQVLQDANPVGERGDRASVLPQSWTSATAPDTTKSYYPKKLPGRRKQEQEGCEGWGGRLISSPQ